MGDIPDRATASPPRDAAARTARAGWGAAIGVAALAVAVRLPWLSRIGLRGDEDISTLAARGIAEFGWPQLPSGAMYWRSPLFHYLIAPLAASGVDWLPRLASVAISALIAVLIVRMGRRWMGDRVAIVGGLLFAVSALEIHVDRQVRMYSLYQLAALLVFWCLFRFWREGTWRWGWASAGAVAVSMLTHQIGVTLAALFLLVAVRQQRWSARIFAVVCVPFFYNVYRHQRWHVGTAFGGGGPPVPEPDVIVHPKPHPFSSGAEIFDGTTSIVLAGLLALVALFIAWGGTPGRPWAQRAVAAAGLAAVMAAAGGHQIGLALLLLALLVVQRPELFPDPPGSRALLAAGATVLVAAVGWGIAGLLAGGGLEGVVFDLTGRSLGRFVRYLVTWPPAIAIPAMLGSLLIGYRSWRGRAHDGERFVLLLVLGLVAARSLVAAKWTGRYLADAWPAWELLAGSALVAAVAWAANRWSAALPGRTAVISAGTLAVLAVALLPGTGVRTLISYVHRGPGDPPAAARRVVGFSTDHRGVAEWLEPRLEPGDRIVATDWLTAYCYLGRLDGWIRTSGYGRQSVLVDGVPRDSYVGARLLTSVEEIETFAETGPVWIVAGGNELRNPNKLDATVKDWLMDHPVQFLAADGETRVFRLARQAEAAR